MFWFISILNLYTYIFDEFLAVWSLPYIVLECIVNILSFLQYVLSGYVVFFIKRDLQSLQMLKSFQFQT